MRRIEGEEKSSRESVCVYVGRRAERRKRVCVREKRKR